MIPRRRRLAAMAPLLALSVGAGALLVAPRTVAGPASPAPSAPEAPVSQPEIRVLDDLGRPDGTSALGTRWKATSDRVMGGVSDVEAARREGERPHLHLGGRVEEVPGYGSPGFVSLMLDLGELDASDWEGLRLVVRGDGETYGAHLRTPQVRRPWQSFRGRFTAPEDWTEVRIPFEDFAPHRLDATLDRTALLRLSLIAVERTGPVHLDVAEVGLYR
jgi:hypothetical protein